ncbi:MAG TPA: 5-(carboxyamino)imidazole ribonucleotide synthase [Rheinheimera sp.]|nr:5-(carboxyamino)imidazole ribonucleotide synthase [Rheinheimera sp.]
MKVLVMGAGQLARMMALAGAPLNISVLAYDVNSQRVMHPVTGQVFDETLEQAVANADVVSSEFEHIPYPVQAVCEASGKFKPNSRAIKAGGDRRQEKALLDAAGVANAGYRIVQTETEFKAAINELGLPLVLKSALAGYDGKGQWRLKRLEDAQVIWQDIEAFMAGADHTLPQAIVAEQFVRFDREVSLVGARNEHGDTVVYPLTENHHVNGVLAVSTALPSESALQQQAKQMFDAVANELNYVGVLALEFFQVGDKLLVNEIAPRVHNSGHWTQQGADTCQFENHLRAVCGLPLGSTALVRPTVMVNILGEDYVNPAVLSLPSCHLHWYGKGKRPGRKMGHINICGATPKEMAARFSALSALLPEASFPEVAEVAAALQQRVKAL